jgi:UDP-N-acetyl-D-mannosaminuronic acid dehydrogenase
MQKTNEQIVIVGLGYIGLPTAVMLANCGYDVIGYDVDRKKINAISNREISNEEPGLILQLDNALKTKKLLLTSYLPLGSCYVIAVPTPVDEKSKQSDLKILEEILIEITKQLKQKDLVIIESTVPVGTTRTFEKQLIVKRPDLISDNKLSIDICYCPERVIPGAIIKELQSNARVIGGNTPKASERASEIYKRFVTSACVPCSLEEAEMAKITENAYRDVNIAFANEIELICFRNNISAQNVIELTNLHPRVEVLRPGIGVGGHCIAVDPWFLINQNKEITPLMQAARTVNKGKEKEVAKRIEDIVRSNKKIPQKILLLGIAYKPNVSDFRESPAINIIKSLQVPKDIKIHIHDPNINTPPRAIENYRFIDTPDPEAYDMIFKLVDHSGYDELVVNNARLIDMSS